MASLVTWSLYTDAGTPLTGATIGSSGIHFVDYCDRNGTARAQPTIQEFGGGVYGFTSGPDDDRVGTLYLIANGTANPARYSGRVTTDAQASRARALLQLPVRHPHPRPPPFQGLRRERAPRRLSGRL